MLEKLAVGAVGGGLLGLIASIVALFQGTAFGESIAAIPAGIIVGVIAVLWATKDNTEADRGDAIDSRVLKLQNRLRQALDAAAYYEAQGNHTQAAYRRADAAVIESQLRNLGS